MCKNGVREASVLNFHNPQWFIKMYKMIEIDYLPPDCTFARYPKEYPDSIQNCEINNNWINLKTILKTSYYQSLFLIHTHYGN